WILYNEENYTEAAIIYARLVQNSGPGEIFEQSKYLWGLSLNKSEQIERGNEILRELVTETPGSNFTDNALFELARYEFNSAGYEKAYADFKKIVDDFEDSDIYYQAKKMTAECLIELGRYSEAESVYKDLTENADDRDIVASSYYQLGRSRYQNSKTDEALSSFREYLEKYPDH
ncbi:MAG: tetratricopeptide repeat protein, partial [bacterium]|nr:tetratricopeptide repeat protein [bacterium]